MNRLSRLEKNKKANEEIEYRDKYNRIKKKKLADREYTSIFLKGPSNYIMSRSNSNLEMIKKINSYSITKISTATIPNEANNNLENANFNGSLLRAKAPINQEDRGNNIQQINQQERKAFIGPSKAQTNNSTTADFLSNNSENSNNKISENSNINFKKMTIKRNNSKSQANINNPDYIEYFIPEKLTTPKSDIKYDSKKKIDYNEPSSKDGLIEESQWGQTTKNTEGLYNVINQGFNAIEKLKNSNEIYCNTTIISSNTKKTENNNKDLSCSKANSSKEEIKSSNEEFIEEHQNSHLDLHHNSEESSSGCLCHICNNGEVSEKYLGNQIFTILFDIYNCHIKSQNIENTVEKYKQLVHGFCTIKEKKEIIFFVKLFYYKVVLAFKVRFFIPINFKTLENQRGNLQ